MTALVVKIGRWPLLFVLVTIALAVLYKYGPSRTEPRWHWITWGSVSAAVVWLAASALFSWYVASFGSYNKTYGSLGAVIGFMTWIWISIIVVLIGAKLNAEMEHQTVRDSTIGGPKPLGQRGEQWPTRSEKRRPEELPHDRAVVLFRRRLLRVACRSDGGKRCKCRLHPFDIDLGHFLQIDQGIARHFIDAD